MKSPTIHNTGNVVVDGCTFDSIDYGAIKSTYGTYGTGENLNLTVTNTTFIDCGMTGEHKVIHLDGADSVTADNNTLIDCYIADATDKNEALLNEKSGNATASVQNTKVEINEAIILGDRFTTLEDAIGAYAESEGQTITLIRDIVRTDKTIEIYKAVVIEGDGHTITTSGKVTVTGVEGSEATLNNVKIVMSGSDAELTVSNLKFTGDSYINANDGAALTVTECEANVTPTKAVMNNKTNGRAAFIVTGTEELPTLNHGLLLNVTDNTIIVHGDNDSYAAAIFGWRYLADGTTISGNTFGSEETPYTFIAVKLMNAMDGAEITLSENTVYGTNELYHFAAFDLYQNCSRDNTYTVMSENNEVIMDTTGTYTAYPFYLEGNGGTNVILLDSGTTVNGNAITLDDVDASGLPDGYNKYYGVDVVTDDAGDLIGGTFGGDVSAINLECAVGYEAIENEDGSYTVGIKDCTISVVSDIRVSVKPGNTVKAFTDVTLTAWPQDGYVFEGWYENGSDECLSTNLTYTFKVYDDVSLVAKCKNVGSKTLIITGESGTYKVDGVKQNTNYFRSSYNTYSEVLVEAANDGFLYWMNEDSKIMCTSESYPVTMAHDTYLTPIYEMKSDEGIAVVEFISYQKQVLKAVTYTTTSTITYPAAPSRVGHEFTGWTLTPDEIIQKIADGEKYIVVEPVYTKLGNEYALTAIYPNGDQEEFLGTNGELVKLSAKELDGMTFNYWSSDVNGTEVLSYRSDYNVLMTKNVIIYAIYSTTEVEAEPVVVVSDIYRNEDKVTLHFATTRSVPEGYTVTNAGVIYTTNSEVGTDEESMVLDNDVVKEKHSNEESLSNQGHYILNMTMTEEASKDKVLYLRGYVTVKDSEGNGYTIYSAIASGSYNTVRSQD